MVLGQEHAPPRFFDDIVEEAEVGDRHGEAVFCRTGALVRGGGPGTDDAVRFGGIGLKEVQMGAQEFGLDIGQQQEVVDIGQRGDVLEQVGSAAPELVRGAGGVVSGTGEFVEVWQLPGVLRHAVRGARAG